MQHLRFLHYLDAVARCGSIRAAAERLHVAASAVNRRIQDLEAELFVAYARRREADLAQVRSQIAELQGEQRGVVRLVASQALAPVLLPRAIHAFQQQRPGIGFEVQVLDRARAVQAVADFEADLGLVFNPPELQGMAVLAQARQRTCAVVPAGHPLAQRASVRLKDCLPYPLALPDASLSGRGVLEELFNATPERPSPQLVANSHELMRGFAREAQGVGFQIEIGVDTTSGDVAIPIAERGLPTGRLVLFAHRHRSVR